MFDFLKKKKPLPPRPINVLNAPPDGYVIVRDGHSIKMMQAIIKALRFDAEGKVDYVSVQNGWREAFNILKDTTENNLGDADTIITRQNN